MDLWTSSDDDIDEGEDSPEDKLDMDRLLEILIFGTGRLLLPASTFSSYKRTKVVFLGQTKQKLSQNKI